MCLKDFVSFTSKTLLIEHCEECLCIGHKLVIFPNEAQNYIDKIIQQITNKVGYLKESEGVDFVDAPSTFTVQGRQMIS